MAKEKRGRVWHMGDEAKKVWQAVFAVVNQTQDTQLTDLVKIADASL